MELVPDKMRVIAIQAFLLVTFLGLPALHNFAAAEPTCTDCKQLQLERARILIEKAHLLVQVGTATKVTPQQQSAIDIYDLDLKIVDRKLAECAACKDGKSNDQGAEPGTKPTVSGSPGSGRPNISSYAETLRAEIQVQLSGDACEACRSEKKALAAAVKKYKKMKERLDKLRDKPEAEKKLLKAAIRRLNRETGRLFMRTTALRQVLYKCVVEHCINSDTFLAGTMSASLNSYFIRPSSVGVPMFALFVKPRCPEAECVDIAKEINNWILETYPKYKHLPTKLENSLFAVAYGSPEAYQAMTPEEKIAAHDRFTVLESAKWRDRFDDFLKALKAKKKLLEECEKKYCKLEEDAPAGQKDAAPESCFEQKEAMMGSAQDQVVVGSGSDVPDREPRGTSDTTKPADCDKPEEDKAPEEGVEIKPVPSKPLSTGGIYDSENLLFEVCRDVVFDPGFEEELWSLDAQWKPAGGLEQCWQPPLGGITDEIELFQFPIDGQIGWVPQYWSGRGEMRQQLLADFPAPNDPYYDLRDNLADGLEDMWGLKRIGLFDALANTSSKNNQVEGEEVIVAVIDSGLDAEHPDLQGMVWMNPHEVANNQKDDDDNGLIDDTVGWNFLDNNNDTRDTSGHGTLVAGIFAARSNNGIGIAGINPWARIMPIKVTNYHGMGSSADVAAAVSYATRMGASVINISLGGTAFSAAELAAIEYAQKQDVLVVVAAGNDSIDAAGFWPAALENVITVAALARGDKRSAYSNWGAPIDIAAPGSNILSLRARETDAMMFADKEYTLGSHVVGKERFLYQATGTSFAAPFVAGAASLVRSLQPELTAEQVRRKLLQSAIDIETLGVDSLTGYGLLNVRAALDNTADFFIEAAIAGARPNQESGELKVQFIGTADANQFKSATLELGEGEAPKRWRRLGGTLKRSVVNNVLAEISASELRSSPRWTVRLRVTHKDGSERSARFALSLQ